MTRRLPCLVALSLSAALLSAGTRADEPDELHNLRDTDISLINLLVEEGLISRDKADALIHRAQQKTADKAAGSSSLPAPAPAAADGVARAPSNAAGAGPETQNFRYTGQFDTLSARLPENHGDLDRIAESLRGASIDRIEATGHTDNTPIRPEHRNQFPDNYALSLARADAVAGYLGAALKLRPDQVKSIGKAADEPIASNNTEQGRRMNRRVELTVTSRRPAVVAAAAPASAPAASGAAAPAAAVAAASTDSKGTVHVNYVPEIVKQEIRDEVKQEVLAQARKERWGEPGALPAWLNRFTLSADFRLRYELDSFPNGTPPNAPVQALAQTGYFLNNDSDTRNRLRIRGRFGFEAKISDQISAGLRVATGGASGGSNPVSENQTLGNYDTRASIGVDRAYLSYKPASWVTITGGRFANPFFAPTELVWSVNYSPEGLVTKFNHAFGEDLVGIVTVGAFPVQLQDNEISKFGAKTTSKWMYGYQAGLGWRFADDEDVKFAVAFYDYRNVEGRLAPLDSPNEFDYTAAGFRQEGNTVFDIHNLANTQNNVTDPASYLFGLSSKFRELNGSGRLDIADFKPIHIVIDGDYVKNLGYKQKEVMDRTGGAGIGLVKNRTEGYETKVTVGMPEIVAAHQWNGFLGYRYVEGDAVLDAFTNADFLLGGTDNKGYFLGGQYGVARNTAITLRWMSGKAIDLQAASTGALRIDVLQLDLSAAF